MYSSDLLKYCHAPPPAPPQTFQSTPGGSGSSKANAYRLPALSSFDFSKKLSPFNFHHNSHHQNPANPVIVTARPSSLDTLTSVAQQSFGLYSTQPPAPVKQDILAAELPSLGQHMPLVSRSHASSVSSTGSNTSVSSLSSVSSISSSNSSGSDKNVAVETSFKRKRRCNLPKKSTTILMNWLNDNVQHPYPNSKEKLDLMRKTGLTSQQLSNWFINARRRKINNIIIQKESSNLSS